MGIKSFINVITLAERLGIDKVGLHKEYPKTETSRVIESQAKHRYIVGRALGLVERMVICGDYEAEDILRAEKYVLVAIDALKYELDYQKAFNELGIQKLYDLYPRISKQDKDEEQ